MKEGKSGGKILAVDDEHKQQFLFTPRSHYSLQEGPFSDRQSDASQKGGILLHNGFQKHLSSESNGVKLSKSGPLKKVRKLSLFSEKSLIFVVLNLFWGER
jgi:hypothetical protein